MRYKMVIDNFEDFKNEYFNGDQTTALKQLAYEGYSLDFKYCKNKENAQIIADTLEEDLANEYLEYFKEYVLQNPELFKRTQSLAISLTQMDMSLEEFQKMDKNPFKAKSLISVLITLIGIGILLTAYAFAGDTWVKNAVSVSVPLFGVFMSSAVGNSILNYFNFKFSKKILTEIESKKQNETGTVSKKI